MTVTIDSTRPRDNLGYAVLQLIARYGVRTVFGIPGTHNLEFYRHLGRLGIHAVTARHEQGAGYAADAWAKRSRLPGVVIATSGPGVLNVLSAAGTAYCESRPMIVLAPGPALGGAPHGSGALHETKDQVKAASGVFDSARRVASSREALDAVHDAFRTFALGRPRPVYIEIPLDLLEATVDPSLAGEAPLPLPAVTVPDADRVAEVARLLAAARRPLIVAGGGAVGASNEVRVLAEMLSAPVLSTLNGKGVLSEAHPLSLGAELRQASAMDLVRAADLVLVLGSKLSSAERRGRAIRAEGTVVRVDILESQRDHNLRADHSLIGDAAGILAALLRELGRLEVSAESQNIDEMRHRISHEAIAFDAVSMSVGALITDALPPEAMVSGDSSQIIYNGVGSTLRSHEPNAYFYMATYCTLGYSLPAAIGAKIADPSRPSIAITGDGALMFSVQEMQTATEQRLDITIICVDNGGYGEIRQNELDRGVAPIGVDLVQPDWPLLARAFGGTGFSVASPDALAATIREAIATPGVTLVHLPLSLFT